LPAAVAAVTTAFRVVLKYVGMINSAANGNFDF
jgi:hypothetical protein